MIIMIIIITVITIIVFIDSKFSITKYYVIQCKGNAKWLIQWTPFIDDLV